LKALVSGSKMTKKNKDEEKREGNRSKLKKGMGRTPNHRLPPQGAITRVRKVLKETGTNRSCSREWVGGEVGGGAGKQKRPGQRFKTGLTEQDERWS